MKSVFPTLLYAIIACVILSLGCSSGAKQILTVGEEICNAACENIGGKFYLQYDHACFCVFEMPHYRPSTRQDAPSTKQDVPQKQDNVSIGGTIVLR